MLIRNRIRTEHEDGFTLVEMLVAVAALGFVMMVILNSFSVSRNTYTVIDNVSETHQNSLAIASLVERDIRMAGFMVHDGLAACGLDSTTSPDVLFLSDADAIQNPEDLPSAIAASDLGAAVTAGIGAVAWGGGTITVTVDDLVLDGTPTYDEDATAGADSDFQAGGGIIITDLDDPSRGVACGIIVNNGVNVGANQVSFQLPVTPGGQLAAVTVGAPGDNWRAVPAHVYQVTGTDLFRDGTLLANDVEDLQLRWFYDASLDGQIDAGELAGDTTASRLNNSSLPGDPDTLREISVSLVLRTSEVDPTNASAGAGQPTQNRTAASAPGVDGRRRRVYSSTVRLRNIAS